MDSLAARVHRGHGALDPAPHYLQVRLCTCHSLPQDQCWETVTFWLGSADPRIRTVIARISVIISTLHSFISVKKIFDEHVYLTQNAHES